MTLSGSSTLRLAPVSTAAVPPPPMAALLNPAVTIQEVVQFRSVTLVVGLGALKQTITIKPGDHL